MGLTERLVFSLDDPIMWGVLPLKYVFNPVSLRWGLGAHDICFKNKQVDPGSRPSQEGTI